MTDPRHDGNNRSDGGSADERALSEAYRAHAGEEPSPALDARVLAAAHRAVPVEPHAVVSRRRLRIWAVPVASAAALVLAVLVSLRVHDAANKAPPPASSPVPAADVEKAADSAKIGAAKPAATAPLQTPAASRADRAVPVQKSAAGNITSSPSPAPAQGKPEIRQAMPAAEGAATAPARYFATPKNWWAHIRELQRQGRHAEAAASLAAFREAYPGVPVPKDIGVLDGHD
jgi:Meckel syndrome type 1 protein